MEKLRISGGREQERNKRRERERERERERIGVFALVERSAPNFGY